MRTIQAFVLRLLIDPAEPLVLRGSIQSITNSETHPFADQQALLTLMLQLIRQSEGKAAPGEESQLPPDGVHDQP